MIQYTWETELNAWMINSQIETVFSETMKEILSLNLVEDNCELTQYILFDEMIINYLTIGEIHLNGQKCQYLSQNIRLWRLTRKCWSICDIFFVIFIWSHPLILIVLKKPIAFTVSVFKPWLSYSYQNNILLSHFGTCERGCGRVSIIFYGSDFDLINVTILSMVTDN